VSDEPEFLDVVIPAGLDGVRLDRGLALLTGLSRSETSALVERGDASLDDVVQKKSSVTLAQGQVLSAVLPPPPPESVVADASVDIDVVYEDEDLLFINKKPGQVVHPGAGREVGTVAAGLVARYPEIAALAADGYGDPFRPGIVHRLDKGTSGLLVVARTPLAFESLSAQMKEHGATRVYLGLVDGHVQEERGLIDAPLGRSSATPTMMAVRSDGRPARTHYEVLARLETPATTLLRLILDTGRTHQIRVHVKAIGHPIVNDRRYGHRRDKRLDEDRFFLHATALEVTHPRTGERVGTQVPLPVDLAALVSGVVF
jgi:23S rRNA pseudouridine1911/1915/1917 synthase